MGRGGPRPIDPAAQLAEPAAGRPRSVLRPAVRLLHLLQRLLLLLLSLIVAIIGGEATAAGQVRWGLGNWRPEGPLAGAGMVASARRTDAEFSTDPVVSGRAASKSASMARAAAPAKISCISRNCRRCAPTALMSWIWEGVVVVICLFCSSLLAAGWEVAIARI